MVSSIARLREIFRLTTRGFWFVGLEAILTLLVARSLWTWRDDAYVFLADVPSMLWLSIGLTASVVLSLVLLSRGYVWLRRLGWSLTVARFCLLPLIDLVWNPAMSPCISLW
ncbi:MULTISPECIES: hypothetical protein [unclassified Streptomyces]|uniref:hypothetical protein n=2 Tax=Streptomyces TaxID=1883 RepID=UPI00224E77A1|nr:MULTISPECIES: hypothetical protein [unclassified Streptomyces]MCX4987274.1 hypothetical protein [Streptomyces sp. NBC_00568]MCX5007594.1 hypothetical protein [Streptomyces sp. NBC_00638]